MKPSVQETEYRVKEITENVEQSLNAVARAAIEVPAGGLSISGGYADKLTQEQKAELVYSWTRDYQQGTGSRLE